MEATKQSDTTEDILAYFKIQYEVVQLKAARHAANATAGVFAAIIFTSLICLALILFSVGLALLLSEWLDSYYKGFLATGGLFIMVTLILFALRQTIILNPIRNKMISSILSSSDKTKKP